MVPQDIALYPDLSARENLVFWGKMYGLRGAELKHAWTKCSRSSGWPTARRITWANSRAGMKRRVNIGAALLHKPAVVIMDEPTVGIDPQSRRHILDNVKELNRQGMTVLYTTHYMEEAAELSHHIAIMDQGKVIAYGTHDELIRLVGEQDPHRPGAQHRSGKASGCLADDRRGLPHRCHRWESLCPGG